MEYGDKNKYTLSTEIINQSTHDYVEVSQWSTVKTQPTAEHTKINPQITQTSKCPQNVLMFDE